MSALSLALGLAGGMLVFKLFAWLGVMLWGFFRLEMVERDERARLAAWRARHGRGGG